VSDGTVVPVVRSDILFSFYCKSDLCHLLSMFVHKQFKLLFCRAAVGNTPQAAYSSFPL